MLLLRLGWEGALTIGTAKAVVFGVSEDGLRTIAIDSKGAFSNRNFAVSRLDIRPDHFYAHDFFRTVQ